MILAARKFQRRKLLCFQKSWIYVAAVWFVVYMVTSLWFQHEKLSELFARKSTVQEEWRKERLRNVSRTLDLLHRGTNTTATNPEAPVYRRYYPGRKAFPLRQEDDNRPALTTLIKDDEIIGNVQFLLDFAIVGFGKAGTTTLMEWLARHPSVAVFSREVYDLVQKQPAKLVRSLYEDLPAGNYTRGYKNPLEVTQKHVLDYYRTYWPHTKLLIGLRHPIHWFESLYNFRVQNLSPGQPEIPNPNDLVGRCYRFNICTEKGNFAYYLMQLGKTSDRSISPLTQQIIGRYARLWFNVSQVPAMPNPVFLYHMEEMKEAPDKLAGSVVEFLGLDAPIVPSLPHAKPGLDIIDENIRKQKERQKIDICNPAYRPVRAELVRIGTLGARWIEEEFLSSSSTIHVSDPDGFRTLLRRWSVDPCPDAAPGVSRAALRRVPPKNDPIIRPFQYHTDFTNALRRPK